MRNFVAHHSQLTSIAVRPAYNGPYFDPTTEPVAYRRKGNTNTTLGARAVASSYMQEDSAYTTRASVSDGVSAPATQPDQHTGLLDVSMPSPGDAHETSSLFGDDPPENMETHGLDDSTGRPSGGMLGSPPQPRQAARPDGAAGAINPDGDDAKSEGSYDSLFGDDGDENEKPEPVGIQTPQSTQAGDRPASKNPYAPLAMPSAYQTPAPTSQFVTFPVGLSNPPDSQQQQHGQSPYYSTQTFPVQLPQQPQQQNVVQPYQPPQPAPTSRPVSKPAAPIPPPKNAPPLLDRNGYSNFSSDLLMTAYVDGQVILWDRRVSSPGRGVGRLWMSEKTPPWCLSVSIHAKHP